MGTRLSLNAIERNVMRAHRIVFDQEQAAEHEFGFAKLLRRTAGALVTAAAFLSFFLWPMPTKLVGIALLIGALSGILFGLPDKVFGFIGAGLYVLGGGAVAQLARHTPGVAQWGPILVTAGATVLAYFGVSWIRYAFQRKQRSS